ncbi:Fungal lipase-like domain containing protein, partial [Parasponia andersonii]
ATCEAAYFVIVLHHLRSVVIAVRGTETPEDLIIDGLCRECILSAKDLDGLINSSHINPELKQSVVSSFPHYGHSGIVEAARNLFTQLEGNAEDDDSDSSGLLSSILGAGCECEGYNVRIVGHSLGGAIAALLGMRLYHRYPNLHVYAYGPLPCVDSIIAEACSHFVTSIVLNNEFSSRLSVGSILRLRAAAITALSHDSATDTAMICRLARRFLYVSNCERNSTEVVEPASYVYSGTIRSENLNDNLHGNEDLFDSRGGEEHDHNFPLFNESNIKDSVVESESDEFTNPFATEINTCDDPVSEFMETARASENASAGNPPEMYLPGFIIHMVPQPKSFHTSLWKGQGVQEREKSYKAYIANRDSFKDIVVSPSMFLDHLPWRCHDAMQKVLEVQCTLNLNESHIVDVY